MFGGLAIVRAVASSPRLALTRRSCHSHHHRRRRDPTPKRRQGSGVGVWATRRVLSVPHGSRVPTYIKDPEREPPASVMTKLPAVGVADHMAGLLQSMQRTDHGLFAGRHGGAQLLEVSGAVGERRQEALLE